MFPGSRHTFRFCLLQFSQFQALDQPCMHCGLPGCISPAHRLIRNRNRSFCCIWDGFFRSLCGRTGCCSSGKSSCQLVSCQQNHFDRHGFQRLYPAGNPLGCPHGKVYLPYASDQSRFDADRNPVFSPAASNVSQCTCFMRRHKV